MKIEILTTPDCSNCKVLEKMLDEMGIEENDWEPFFVVASEKLLTDLGGLIIFANDDVKNSVQSKYL